LTDALLNRSHGTRPEVLLDDVFPEGIAAIDLAAEAGTLLVATSAGKLILLNRDGSPLHTDRNYRELSQLVWADAGNFGAAVLRDDRVVCFDRSLRQIWELRITGRVTALAIAPHGSHIAFSTDSCRTHLVTIDKKDIARFETHRALDHLRFLSEEAALVGAAEFGSLCSFDLNGKEQWSENIMNNIGDMSISGCGRRILLSAFNHGVQLYSKGGKQRGAFMLDGIPSRVSGAAIKTRLAAITLDSRVYWLNFEGDIQWVADMASDPPQHICTGPLGDCLYLTTLSGRLLKLSWT
jgi:hypothetical protein